jgi:hypothetical protein
VGLLGNYSVLSKTMGTSLGGIVSSGDLANWNKSGVMRNRARGVNGRQVSIPLGFTNQGAWFYPATVGGMALRADGDGQLSANLLPSRNMQVNFIGQGDLTAFAGLVVSMICAMAGSGTLVANCSGALNMATTFTGSGGLAAGVSALAAMTATMAGTGGLAAAIAAYGEMEIDITVTGAGLSVSNVGAAVWDALATLSNNPGSMGELLNQVSAGGLSPTQQALLEEIHRRLGLDALAPLTTTPTSIVAGDIDLVLTGDGETTTTVTRQ